MDDMSRLQLENQCLKEQIASMDQAVKLLAEELASISTECGQLPLQNYTGLEEIVPLDSQADGSIERIGLLCGDKEGPEAEIRYRGLVQKTADGKAASAMNVKLSAEVEELLTEKSRLNARNEELKARWEAERFKHEALDTTMSYLEAETSILSLLQLESDIQKALNSQLASEIKMKRQEFEDDKRSDAAAIRRLMEKKQGLEVANGILRKELSDMGLLSGHPNKDPGAVQDEENISKVETTQMIRPEAEDSKTKNQECKTTKKATAGAATESKADRLQKELNDMGLRSGHPNKDPGAVQDEQIISEVETTQMIRPESEDSETKNQECETKKKATAGAAKESKADRLRKELNDMGLRSGHPNKDSDAVPGEEIISEVETILMIRPDAEDSETKNQECKTEKKAMAGTATESKTVRLRKELNDMGLRSGHPNKDPGAVQDEEIISKVEATQMIRPEAEDSETKNQECETEKNVAAVAATESKADRLRAEIERAYEETCSMQGQKRELEALHRQKEEESAESLSKLNAAKRERSVSIEKLKALVDRRQEEIESLRLWNDEAAKRLGSFKPESIRRHIVKLGEEEASASDIKTGEAWEKGLSDWIRLESVVDELQMVRERKAALIDEREELKGEIAELEAMMIAEFNAMIEGGSGCGAQTF